MYKTALKIVGVVFGIVLIIVGIIFFPVEYSSIGYEVSFYRADSYLMDDGSLAEDVLVAHISDEGYESNKYVVEDTASNAVDMAVAHNSEIIADKLRFLSEAACLLLVIFGAGIIAVSLCIKTDEKIFKKRIKAAKPLNANVCVQCGADLAPNARFCHKCGLFREIT